MYLVELVDNMGRRPRQIIGLLNTERQAQNYCITRNRHFSWESYEYRKVNLIEED